MTPVLTLGRMPLANALVAAGDDGTEACYPLDLAFCEGCGLVQLTESAPPERMFREYKYFSSWSVSWLEHARKLTERLMEERGLGRDSLVVEVASNDGYLLKNFVERGVPVLGIDPAANVVAEAERQGVRSRCEFFTRESAERLHAEGVRADVVIANNVLAHVPDPVGLLAGARRLLKPGGTLEIEFPYVVDLIEKTEFDTIYHEHLCYFSLTVLTPMLERAGLSNIRARRIGTHGGSLHISAGAHGRERSDDLLEMENRLGVGGKAYYARFAERVHALVNELKMMLAGLKAEGRSIAAYGAAAKGATLLNFAGLGSETLDFVVDRSSAKQGWRMPGSRVPIEPTEALLERRPDYTLLLAWNLADEILAQEAAYRAAGGRFIIPIPKLRVV